MASARPSALAIASLTCCSIGVGPRQPSAPLPPSAPATQAPTERMEAAHEDMGGATRDAARDAGRLTEAVAGRATPARSRPIPRRNFIDRIVFDRIEKDRIPHAG